WIDGKQLGRVITLEQSHQGSVQFQSDHDTIPTITGSSIVEIKLGTDLGAGKAVGTVVVYGAFAALPPPPTTLSLGADLTGAAGFTQALGKGAYTKVTDSSGSRSRLTVYVQKTGLRSGATLDVYVDGQKLGTGITVNGEGNGYVELQSGRGDSVPNVQAG